MFFARCRVAIGILGASAIKSRSISFNYKPKLAAPIRPNKPITPSTLQVLRRTLHLGIVFIPLGILFPFWYFFNNDLKSTWWLKLARTALEHLGPVFIKFGQWFSCKTDTFPLKV